MVDAEEAGDRLDRVLARHIASLSRSRLKALVLAGNVTVAGEPIRDPSHPVSADDNISVTVPPPEPAKPAGEAIRARYVSTKTTR